MTCRVRGPYVVLESAALRDDDPRYVDSNGHRSVMFRGAVVATLTCIPAEARGNGATAVRMISRRRGSDSQLFTVAVRDNVVEITCARSAASQPSTDGWSHAQCLSPLLRSVLATEARTVIVDLKGSGDANTSLLAVLVDAKSHARRSGTELIMRGSPALNQLAEICRLENVLSTG